jgi:hypothetical protein
MQIARVQLNQATSVAIISGVCVFALASLIVVGVVDAHDPVTQSSPPETVSSVTGAEIKPEPTLSPNVLSKEKRKGKAFVNRRKVVLDFLGEHFPELQESLVKSEEKSQGRFRNAISRLETDVIHLRNLEQKRPAKFELMVDLWKLKTQIEITIAKYAKKESDSQLKERLNPLTEQMLDVQTSITKLERQFAVQRISSIDKRLLHFENNRARIIENNLRSFQKSAEKIRTKQNRKSIQRQSLKSKTKPNAKSRPAEENPN